ncbi:sialate:O-sulfotransferase 1-like [Saccoglossus kowalevskii]
MNSGILLIRNPYDSLISLYKYCKLQSIVPESYRNNEDWIIWNKRKYVGWLSLIESWFESGKPFLVVHYEEMRKDPLNVIQRMLNFLNITFTNERRQCVRSDIEGKFHRKHKGIFTFDPYTKELHELIDKDIQKANSFLMSINETPIAEPTYNRDL